MERWLAMVRDPARLRRVVAALRAEAPRPGALWADFEALLREQPLALARAVAALPEDPATRALLRLIGNAWAGLDRRAAFAWAEELTSPAARTSAFAGALEAWSSTAPAEAAAWLSTSPPRVDMVILTEAIIARWAEQEPTSAAAWLETQRHAPAQQEASRTLGRIWSGRAREASAAWATSLPPSTRRDIAVGAVAEGWALHDASAAIRWVTQQTFSDSAELVDVTYGLASDFAGQNVDASERWLATLPAGELLDEAIRGVADTLRPLQPERALRWLHQLGDGEERAAAVAELLEDWPPGATITAEEAQRRLPPARAAGN